MELDGGMDLGRGTGRRMQRDRDERRESGWGDAVRVGDEDAGGAMQHERGRRGRGQGPSRSVRSALSKGPCSA